MRSGCQLFAVKLERDDDAETASESSHADHVELPANVQVLLKQYHDVFPSTLRGGLPLDRNIDHVIPTEPGAQAKVPYLPRYSVNEVNTIRDTVRELMAQGFRGQSPHPCLLMHTLFSGRKVSEP